MKKSVILICFTIIIGKIEAQFEIPKINLETSTLINVSDSTSFWLFNNQYAKYSLTNSCAIININIEDRINSEKFFDYSYGVEAYTRFDDQINPILHQLYGKIKIWEIIISGGKYEDIQNYSDSLLSSGHILWSKNARPFPKICISSNGYYTIPFTFDLLEVKGKLEHGWFNDERYVDSVLLHHKNLYGRIGKEFPVNIFVGLEHYVQWGGSSPTLGELPSDFDAFIKVFSSSGGDSGTVVPGEVTNNLGNHIGSWNIGMELKTKPFNGILYWQSIFEDNSGRKRQNLPDGLWGININTKNNKYIINNILYEYIHTTDQSGPVHIWNDSVRLSGNDNYFNHGIYNSGWTYDKMTIGIPFITSSQYNSDSNYFRLNNTRIRYHHFGLAGKYKDIYFRSLISFGKNYGTHPNPYSKIKNQSSLFFEISTNLESLYNIQLKTSIGADIGKMYGNNLSFFISLNKQIL
ncbi:capsule assembly Wzi family protein [Bacteroidota bacterium]